MIPLENEHTSTKVLIVDDIFDNIQVLGNILNKRGLDVSFATSGQQAIDIVSYDKIDLILLDIAMPVMDGYEVCSILKSNPKTSSIPVIFLTAKTQSEEIVKGFTVGGVDYIVKPINTAELLARVNTHLEIKKARERQERLLIQQSKMAAMGEMINVIAHQLKQPLNRLSLTIQTVSFDYLDGKIDDSYISNLEKELLQTVFFMSATINDFKNFFSPNKKEEVFDVKMAIGAALSVLASQLSDEKISYKLTCQVHGDMFDNYAEITECQEMAIKSYKNEFIHAILNIINNAKDAILEKRKKQDMSIQGHDEISIDLSKEGDTIKIMIKDTGGGIPDALLEKVFDYGMTSKNDKGSGIGLHISKVIIEKNIGGRLSVENKDNGAVFTIELHR
ncbi:MAG: response regulator [Nitrospirae bacterium]|nr:response regulator [Nitrospirota bacterium]